MRISKAAIAAALAFACELALCQPFGPTLWFSPRILWAGAGPTELQIYAQGLNPGLTVRWNGSDRPSTFDSMGNFRVQLTGEDVARPGLAEVTFVNAATGAVAISGFVCIGYDVKPGDVVFDRFRNRFYLTTPAQPGDTRFPGNSVVALDPASGAIGPTLAAGLGLGSLALSEDGSALYVAADSDGIVKRVNPETLAAVSEFRFRPVTSRLGGYGRSAIAVAPGKPGTVAVYYHPDTTSSGTSIAIFDSGVKRGGQIGINGYGFDGMMFSPDGNYLFLGSFANFSSPQTVLRFSVNASGLPPQTPASAPGGGPVVIRDGVLYTSRGTMIGVETMEVLNTLGVTAGSLAVDPVNKRILAVYFRVSSYYSDYPQYLQTFDFATQQPLGWLPLDTVNYVVAGSSPVQRLIRFGTDGLLYTSGQGLLLFHTPLAGPAPVTEARAVVNAASQQGGGVAPGEIVSIYGANLGPETPVSAVATSSGVYGAETGHVQVWFDRLPGTVLMTYQGQLNVIAPFALKPGSTVNLQVWHFGIPSAKVPLTVSPAAPAIFTRDGSGRGLAAVVNQNQTRNTPSPPGSVIALWGTGGGPTEGVVDGVIARSARNLTGTVRVSIGGRDVPVLYAGAAPSLPNGVFQLNVQVPPDALPGITPISVTVNGQESPKEVTLEIR